MRGRHRAQARANLVVTGEVLRFGSSFKLSLRLHETRDGRLLAGAQASGTTVDELDRNTKQAVAELLAPLRNVEWVTYCDSTETVSASFYEGGKLLATRAATQGNQRCVIALGAEGCPRHPELAKSFGDAADGSEHDRVRCLHRAVDFHNYCGSTEAITATFFEAGKPVASKSSKRRCDITFPAEGCPAARDNPNLAPFAKEGGTLSDWFDGADDDPARCMRRASEWVSYCWSSQAVVAHFIDNGQALATQRADQRCEIALPAEGCPAHKETAGTFNDVYDGADRDPARCQRRAVEWHDYCANTKPVNAAFYQAGQLVNSTKTTP